MQPHALAAILAVLLAAPVVAEARQPRQAEERMRFRGMDRNNDGIITRAEWRGSDQSFRVHDWNGDGRLSGDEVRRGAARRRGEVDYDEADRGQFDEWTDAGFRGLDHDRNDRISREEWHYDRESFTRADRDGDGVLSRREFLNADSDDDRGDRFDYLDANRNGRVERTEWHASRDAFTWLDRNRDGVLSRQEVVGDAAEKADLFAGLDANNDGTITTAEWQWSRRSFARQDQNGDGQLTRAELTNAELSAAGATAGTSGTAVANGRAVTVDASRGWVDTGIDVRSGDILSIQASGTVTLSTNTADAADPGGSRTNRRAQSSPLPNESAGALIARIGCATPFIVGARQSVTANATGRLFMSVNDDFFDDNRGVYRVVVAVGR